MLTVVLSDVRWLEILRVLGIVEDSTEGLEVIRIVHKLRSTSCVDDVPCIHYEIGYLLPIVPAVVVVAIWLRPRGLVCPGSMVTCNFLILLVSLILLLQLLLSVMASRSATCLRYDCCSGLDRVPWSEDNGFYLSSCSTAFLARCMTRSISGF